MDNEPLDLSSGRWLNETAIRTYALDCSKNCRNGKFTRVGEEFIDEVKADVEALLRELRSKHSQLNFPPVPVFNFVTGNIEERISLILNEVIGRIVQRKVERQPSRGVTLGRTR